MNVFKIEEYEFENQPGVMVSQIVNGRQVVSQFIPINALKNFCAMIGKPELYTEYINQDN